MDNQNYNILCVIGGISLHSINQQLFEVMRTSAPQGVALRPFAIQRLPFFSQDIENDPPDTVVAWKDMIRQADAVLFITPEYNRSFPGVLKNAIDWGSRPYGENLWDGKPAAVMGASIGNIGTFGAQHHLRQVLAYLNVPTMGQPEFYLNASKTIDQGKVKDAKTQAFIEEFWASFIQWIARFVDTSATTYPSQGLEDAPNAPH